jgi:putative membrane protein
MFLWLKALHVMAVIAWMAGLFYLPRLFVYHARAAAGGELSETLKVMERRLANTIMLPAGIAAWVLGVGTAVSGGYIPDIPGWLWAKLALVLVLTGFHGVLVKHLGEFAEDERDHGERYFRVLNEVPTILLIGIVILVVVRPI